CVLAAAGSLHEHLADAARAMVHVEHEVEPVQQERERLQENYKCFVEALEERGWIEPRLREAAFTDLGGEES
ncbi:MAG TPA: hypothetical protein VK988_09200, partial [Acidimicrobiales bacterium]|nr:hypothetical protein [Acidimicrobiales bacterium]